ncbi:hypothetical protein BDR26DRAFT_963382 [Obelidium mucronatum]|nr:hypothetical protein BDR26DRAFT_963382 [Obelidium mucronatum]
MHQTNEGPANKGLRASVAAVHGGWDDVAAAERAGAGRYTGSGTTFDRSANWTEDLAATLRCREKNDSIKGSAGPGGNAEGTRVEVSMMFFILGESGRQLLRPGPHTAYKCGPSECSNTMVYEDGCSLGHVYMTDEPNLRLRAFKLIKRQKTMMSNIRESKSKRADEDYKVDKDYLEKRAETTKSKNTNTLLKKKKQLQKKHKKNKESKSCPHQRKLEHREIQSFKAKKRNKQNCGRGETSTRQTKTPPRKPKQANREKTGNQRTRQERPNMNNAARAVIVKILIEDAETISRMTSADVFSNTLTVRLQKALAEIDVHNTRIAAVGEFLHITCSRGDYQKMWSELSITKGEEGVETFLLEDDELAYGHEVVILGYNSHIQQTNTVSHNTKALFEAKGRFCSSISSKKDEHGNWTSIAHCKDQQQKAEFLKPGCFVIMGSMAVIAYDRMIDRELRVQEGATRTLEIPQLPASLQDMRILETETHQIPDMMHWRVVYNGKHIPKSLEVVMKDRTAMERLKDKVVNILFKSHKHKQSNKKSQNKQVTIRGLELKLYTMFVQEEGKFVRRIYCKHCNGNHLPQFCSHADDALKALVKKFLNCEADRMTMAKLGLISQWKATTEASTNPYPKGFEKACAFFKLTPPKPRDATVNQTNPGTAFRKQTGTAPGLAAKSLDNAAVNNPKPKELTIKKVLESEDLRELVEHVVEGITKESTARWMERMTGPLTEMAEKLQMLEVEVLVNAKGAREKGSDGTTGEPTLRRIVETAGENFDCLDKDVDELFKRVRGLEKFVGVKWRSAEEANNNEEPTSTKKEHHWREGEKDNETMVVPKHEWKAVLEAVESMKKRRRRDSNQPQYSNNQDTSRTPTKGTEGDVRGRAGAAKNKAVSEKMDIAATAAEVSTHQSAHRPAAPIPATSIKKAEMEDVVMEDQKDAGKTKPTSQIKTKDKNRSYLRTNAPHQNPSKIVVISVVISPFCFIFPCRSSYPWRRSVLTQQPYLFLLHFKWSLIKLLYKKNKTNTKTKTKTTTCAEMRRTHK